MINGPEKPPVLRRWIVALLCCASAGCGTVKMARVVALGDVPAAESVWRPEGERSEPLLVDTEHAFYRTLKTSLWVEPPLRQYVRQVLEAKLGAELDTVRVDFVGFRYAYYFPSRHDDFVLRVELHSDAAGVSGQFEGVVRGIEHFHRTDLFGSQWESEIPSTGSGREAGAERDLAARIECVADRRAYEHRLLIRIAAQRLARSVAISR